MKGLWKCFLGFHDWEVEWKRVEVAEIFVMDNGEMRWKKIPLHEVVAQHRTCKRCFKERGVHVSL